MAGILTHNMYHRGDSWSVSGCKDYNITIACANRHFGSSVAKSFWGRRSSLDPLGYGRKSKGPAVINLQILLRNEHRSPAAIEKVREIVQALGMKPTSSGAASVSAEMESDAFETLFCQKAPETPSRAPSSGDFGAPGGSISKALPVPEILQALVESITVAPPYIHF
jgi:hypothetical protein